MTTDYRETSPARRSQLKSALDACRDGLRELDDAGDLLASYEQWKYGREDQQSNPAGLLEEARARIERAMAAIRGECRRFDNGDLDPKESE